MKTEVTKDTPYLSLTGEVSGICCEEFRENLAGCKGTSLYSVSLDSRRYSVMYLCSRTQGI